MDIKIDIQGIDQLVANIGKVAPEMQKNALTKALKAGGQVIADEMANQAPRSHGSGGKFGHIADQIRVQAESSPVNSDAEVYVGPSRRVTYKARWQEFGATAHAITTKRKKVLASPDEVFGHDVSHPGEAPRPFMRPALQAAGGAALQAIKQSLADSLAKAIKKASKQ